MGLKIFGTGGVDQKSNHLQREDIDMVDSRNIMRTIRNEYDKRPGTGEDTNFTDYDYNDMIFIKSLNQYFHRFGNDYVTYENGVRRVPYMWANPLISGDYRISLAEYLNTAIFTHEENQNFTAKYDGNSIYRAGLPTPLTTITSGVGTGGFILTFFDFMDAMGNIIFGPATINECLASGSIGFNYTTIKDTGFCASFLKVGLSTTPIVISSSSNVLTYSSCSSDIVVGSKVVFRNRGTTIAITDPSNPTRVFSDNYLILTVTAKTPTELTFDPADFGNKQLTMVLTSGSGIFNVHGGLVLRVFFSTSETTGYTHQGLTSLNGQLVDNSTTTDSGSYTFNTSYDALLSDIYDITTSKLRPPNCKYLLTYGQQLVCVPALSFYDFQNKQIPYTNNDLVMYSDLSTGDLGESFSEINRQLIGDTYDGQITGLTRSRDSLIVTKDRQLFALDGVLIPGQYSMRKIETNEIGCSSFKSILNIDSGFMFQGQDGIYACDSYRIKKISTPLDPFFLNVDFKKTRSVMNSDFDQYLFWTDIGIVVYDYEIKKWYIWDSIDASAGITVDNEKSIRFFSADKSAKFIDQFSDFEQPINAYIMSSWFNIGEPGLLKKATFMRIYAFHPLNQKIDLKYYFDWDISASKGPFTIEMDPNTPTVKRNFDIIQNQSFMLEFRNNYLNEGLNISGYEVNVDVIQSRDKNVK